MLRTVIVMVGIAANVVRYSLLIITSTIADAVAALSILAMHTAGVVTKESVLVVD